LVSQLALLQPTARADSFASDLKVKCPPSRVGSDQPLEKVPTASIRDVELCVTLNGEVTNCLTKPSFTRPADRAVHPQVSRIRKPSRQPSKGTRGSRLVQSERQLSAETPIGSSMKCQLGCKSASRKITQSNGLVGLLLEKMPRLDLCESSVCGPPMALNMNYDDWTRGHTEADAILTNGFDLV
jgi:hypothetical protein